jgi:hypothetical protein
MRRGVRALRRGGCRTAGDEIGRPTAVEPAGDKIACPTVRHILNDPGGRVLWRVS